MVYPISLRHRAKDGGGSCAPAEEGAADQGGDSGMMMRRDDCGIEFTAFVSRVHAQDEL